MGIFGANGDVLLPPGHDAYESPKATGSSKKQVISQWLRCCTDGDATAGPSWLCVALEALRTWWTMGRLRSCRHLIVYTAGETPQPIRNVSRTTPPLVPEGRWTALFFMLVEFLLTLFSFGIFGLNTVPVHVREVAGRGAQCTAWRASVYGIPVILKVDRVRGAVRNEWQRLSGAITWTPAHQSLPIPKYYGLFELKGYDIFLMSDNGWTLEELEEPIPNQWYVRVRTLDVYY